MDRQDVSGRPLICRPREMPGVRSSTDRQQLRPRKEVMYNPAKVFIGNLSWDVDEDSLKDHFEEMNHALVNVSVKVGQDGRSRGYAFVEFATAEDASTAIETFDATELMGRQIVVQETTENKRHRN